MCGRFVLSADWDDFQSRFGFTNAGAAYRHTPRYNIAPSQDCPIIIVAHDRRELAVMRWGLVPAWTKDRKGIYIKEKTKAYKLINIKAETLSEKTTFDEPFSRRRCLVPATGFYEWEKQGKAALPHYFTLASGEPMSFAGLWEQGLTEDGAALLSFTIITTRANDLMARIHDRMPVILNSADEALWLDPEMRNTRRLEPLLQPYPSQLMQCRRVSAFVSSAKNEGPQCIEPEKK